MNTCQTLLSSHVLAAIVAYLRDQAPKCDAWEVLDSETGIATRLHLRSWIEDETGRPGYRLGVSRPIATIGFGLSSGLVAIVEERLDPSSEVESLFEAACMRDLPCVTFRVRTTDTDLAVFVVGEAGAEELRPHVATGIAPIELAIRGQQAASVVAMLPLPLVISSAFKRAVFQVRSVGEGPEGSTPAIFLLEAAGDRIGEANVILDVVLDEQRGDRFNLRCGESCVSVRISRIAAPASRLNLQTCRLHLVVDRTTLDSASWVRAARAAQGWDTGDEPFGVWNRDLRARLANALTAGLPDDCRPESIHLYWFADRPREEGIAVPRGMAAMTFDAAAGRVGETPPSLLAATLTGSAFDYLPGLDLVDAGDEALEIVEQVIGTHHGARDLVIVVGDSPPPPGAADPTDPLWKAIALGSARSNARLSPRFGDTLRALRNRGVPVGWLFLRDARDPDGPGLFLRQFTRFRSLREAVCEGLQQIDGLTVAHCGDTDRMAEGLVALLRELSSQVLGMPWVRVTG